MKNNRNLVIIAAIVIVVLLVGGIYVLASKKSPKPQAPVQQEEVIPSLSPDEIGLSLELSKDGKKVIMEITKVEDLSSVEYQLSYISKGNIPRGAIGTVDVKGNTIRKEITLGTCSDVCHYDQDVTDIKLILKVTKQDGRVYQVEKSF